ncbi:MAG: RNA-binding protein [Candidatus Nitrosocaldaceae archaeon]|nr:MAG: RNA-binding protein [Candidatus Nitrosocaldaceae archaeon]
MKKQYISKSNIVEIIEEAKRLWKIDLPKVKKMLSIELDKGYLLISDDIKMIKVNIDNKYTLLPFLADKELLAKFPSIEVDMGAVKAVCNGASIMRPGIVSMEQFSKDDVVCIKDEKHKQYLAVGIALMDSKEAEGLEKGLVIKNLHYIGDKFWEVYKEV